MFNIFRNQETQQNTVSAIEQQNISAQQNSNKERTKIFVDKVMSDFKNVNLDLTKIQSDLKSTVQKLNEHIAQSAKINDQNNAEQEKFKNQTSQYLENLSKNATDTVSNVTIQLDLLEESHENDISILWERLEKLESKLLDYIAKVESKFSDFTNYDMSSKYVYSSNGSRFKREKVLIHGHYWFADCFREISRDSPYFENILSAWKNILENSNATTYFREKYEWSKENGVLAIALHSKSYSNCTVIGIPNFGAPQNKIPVDPKIYDDFENAPILSRANCENPLEKSGECWFFAKKNEIRNKMLIN